MHSIHERNPGPIDTCRACDGSGHTGLDRVCGLCHGWGHLNWKRLGLNPQLPR